MCYIGVTEEKIEKEDKMSFSIFIFIYTIHLAYLKVYTKFENTEWQKEKLKSWKKEDKIRISILIFIYAILFAYLKVYTKFWNTDSKRSREICDRNFHWRERKMNK